MKTWITGGYVYRYEKRRLERKNLCMENGVITKICSPSEAITDGEVYDVKGKAVVPVSLISILMAAAALM